MFKKNSKSYKLFGYKMFGVKSIIKGHIWLQISRDFLKHCFACFSTKGMSLLNVKKWHCTKPFIITLPSSQYDLNNAGRDVKYQVIITLKVPITTFIYFFFFIFLENKSCHFMWITHKIAKTYFLWKKKKKKKNRMSSATNFAWLFQGQNAY